MMKKLSVNTGFTMLEILSTLVIIGLLASLAAPRFEKAYRSIRFRGASRDVVSTLRLARSMALTDKKQYGVFVDAANLTVTLFQDSLNPTSFTFDPPTDSALRVDTMPLEVSSVYTDFANGVITFAPNGSSGFSGGGSDGANVDVHGLIDGDERCYNIEVRRATGRIRSTPEACSADSV